MAEDGWVVDIVFHALVLVGKTALRFWCAWSTEILLVVSFLMQSILTIFAGFRWRGPCRGREQWDPAIRNVIWFCFVGGDYVATAAVGSLSGSCKSGERQLLAFWAPFFLLHLGGPDNITAYELEDNQLSTRSMLVFILRVLGVVYAVLNSISSGGWTLTAAACLVLVIGIAKYAEKIWALGCANLENIRSSVKEERRRRRHDARSSRRYTRARAMLRGGRPSDEFSRVLFAHSQFHICKRAIVESVKLEFEDADALAESKRFFNDFTTKGRYEVIEAELSLMYDFLYTKAGMVHTWHGYTIRVLSPLATCAAFFLVEFGRKDGFRQADLVVTRLLLVATFLLETVSLVKVLGSSWTSFLLYSAPRWGWLQHQLFCLNRRRRWFPRAIAHLVKVEGHRRWSGRMGQFDILEGSTRHHQQRQPAASREGMIGRLLEKFLPGGGGLISNVHVFDGDEKELVLVLVGNLLNKPLDKSQLERRVGKGAGLLPNKAAYKTTRGEKTLSEAFGRKDRKLYDRFRKSLGTELYVGILIWHIATGIYLSKSEVAKNKTKQDRLQKRVKAIRTLSNYMMFLLVERPYMLAGLVLRSLYEQTSEKLTEIWSNNLRHGHLDSSDSMWWGRIMPWKNGSHSHTQLPDDPQEKLVNFLYQQYLPVPGQDDSPLSYAVQLANDLLKEEEKREMLEPVDRPWYECQWGIIHVILDVWVEMLFYASYRCSGESHARQLCNGGELTTVVWLAAAHIDLLSMTDQEAV